MSLPFDPSGYLPIPYLDGGRGRDGVDCWGLVRLVFADHAGLDLPAWDTVPATDPGAIATAAAAESCAWLPVERGAWRPLDVHLLVESGRPCHVALCIEGPSFLHARRGFGVCVASLADRKQPWSRRLAGAYRHPMLA